MRACGIGRGGVMARGADRGTAREIVAVSSRTPGAVFAELGGATSRELSPAGGTGLGNGSGESAPSLFILGQDTPIRGHTRK